MKLQNTTLILAILMIAIGCKKQQIENHESENNYSTEYQAAKKNFEKGEFENAIVEIEKNLTKTDISKKEAIASHVLKGQSQKKIKAKKPFAAASFQEAIKIADDDPTLETKELGIAHHEYGTTFFRKENEKARENWEKSLRIKKATFSSDDIEISKTLNNLAIYHYEVDGDILKSEDYYNQSIAIKKKHPGQTLSLGKTYLNLGAIRVKLQDFSKAKKYLKEGEKILKNELETNPKNTQASIRLNGIQNNLGAIEMDLGNLSLAKSYFEKTIEIGKKINNEDLQFLGNLNLGRTARKTGDADLALSYLDIAHSKIEQIMSSDIENPYNLFMEYAIVFSELKNDIPKTKSYTKKAIDFLESKGLQNHPNMFNAYQDIGALFLDSERFDDSEGYFQLALKNPVKESIPSFLYSNIGILYGRKGENQKADDYFQKALKYESDLFSEKSKNIARIKRRYADFLYKTGNSKAALKELDEGINLLYDPNNEETDIADVSILIKLLGSKIRFLKRTDKEDLQRLTNLKEAFRTAQLFSKITSTLGEGFINDESKIELREALQTNFELAIATGLDLYKIDPKAELAENIFALLEKFKASVLKEKIRQSNSNEGDSGLNALLQKEQSIINEKRFLKEKDSHGIEIAELNIELKKLKAKIIREYPSYSKLAYHQEPLNIPTLKDNLKNSNTTLVEFFEGADTLYSFVLNGDDILLHRNKLSENFGQNLESLLTTLKNRPTFKSKNYSNIEVKEFTKISQSLFEETITPISNSIKDAKNLLIIPHGKLFYLPFELLISNDFQYSDQEFSELPYLFQSKSIRYEYSSGLVAMDKPSEQPSLQYIGFAPDYNEKLNTENNPLQSLDFNEKEVSETAGLFEGEIAANEKASKTVFENKASTANIIHFAGHALIDLNRPDYSSLIFSGAQKENTLYSYELSDLRLKADLAVLTACDTGQGILTYGEGTMSFARAFKAAGCPNSVTSMWQANDVCSPQFIFEFFANLKNGIGKSQALNQARRTFLERNALDKRLTHPHYWGNFILIGDDEPVTTKGGINLWVFLILISLIAVFFFFRLRR